jgi:hypothetical protein
MSELESFKRFSLAFLLFPIRKVRDFLMSELERFKPFSLALSHSEGPEIFSQTLDFRGFLLSSPWLIRDFFNLNPLQLGPKLTKNNDRCSTPWLIAFFHPPVYNTYVSHYKEAKCFRLAVEPPLYAYGTDLVYHGHVHAYEVRPILAASISFFFSFFSPPFLAKRKVGIPPAYEVRPMLAASISFLFFFGFLYSPFLVGRKVGIPPGPRFPVEPHRAASISDF